MLVVYLIFGWIVAGLVAAIILGYARNRTRDWEREQDELDRAWNRAKPRGGP